MTEAVVKPTFNEYFDSFAGNKNIEETAQSVRLQEALTTADANILLPKVIQQVVTEAAEAQFLATKFFKRINLTEGRSMEFVHFGAMRAEEVGEGQELTHTSSLVA